MDIKKLVKIVRFEMDLMATFACNPHFGFQKIPALLELHYPIFSDFYLEHNFRLKNINDSFLVIKNLGHVAY